MLIKKILTVGKHINVIIDNNTKMAALLSISPCDGRYAKYTKVCQYYFSEYAIQSKRLHIELLYLQELIEINVNIKRRCFIIIAGNVWPPGARPDSVNKLLFRS